MSSSLSNLPLLSQSTVEDTRLELEKLARASAALKAGKLPTSNQLAVSLPTFLSDPFLRWRKLTRDATIHSKASSNCSGPTRFSLTLAPASLVKSAAES